MVSLSLASLALCLVSGAVATANLAHETRVPSTQWRKIEPASQDTMLDMRIVLSQGGLDRGHNLLMEVSEPGSAKYGQYYTAEQVEKLFEPSDTAIEAIRGWLRRPGLLGPQETFLSETKQWLLIQSTVSKLEKLFNTTYYMFEHATSGKLACAVDEYYIPETLKDHIDHLIPGVNLIEPAPQRQHESVINPNYASHGSHHEPTTKQGERQLSRSTCDDVLTVECVEQQYGIPKPTYKEPAKGNRLGIFASSNQSYSQADLNEFFAKYADYIPKGTGPKVHRINGGRAMVKQSEATKAIALQLDFAYPLIYPQGVTIYDENDLYYQTHTENTTGFFNNFLNAIDGSYCNYTAFGITGNSPGDPSYPNPHPEGYKGELMCGVYKPPNVIVNQYLTRESLAGMSINYQRRQCNEYMKLGLRGITVLYYSGFTGVEGTPGPTQLNPCNGDGTIFEAQFPANCPYVTTVGSTALRKTKNGDYEEVATTDISSGGGFSNIFPTASYQKDAVASYLQNNPPPYKSYASKYNDSFGEGGGIYNRAGRGTPDVAALFSKGLSLSQGKTFTFGGEPTALFGSIITRINEELLAAGQPTVGFINPALYAHPEVLNDITIGNNSGCRTGGFKAAKGWDPVTGLGSPNYPVMLKMFKSLSKKS